MKPSPQQIAAAATAIANARGMRRGAPQTVNILDVLPPHLRSELLLDGEAAATAVLDLECGGNSPFLVRAADEMAKAILDLTDRNIMDTRSRAADALLGYCGIRCDVHGDEINAFRRTIEPEEAPNVP